MPFNSASDAFQLHPDVASRGTTQSSRPPAVRESARRAAPPAARRREKRRAQQPRVQRGERRGGAAPAPANEADARVVRGDAGARTGGARRADEVGRGQGGDGGDGARRRRRRSRRRPGDGGDGDGAADVEEPRAGGLGAARDRSRGAVRDLFREETHRARSAFLCSFPNFVPVPRRASRQVEETSVGRRDCTPDPRALRLTRRASPVAAARAPSRTRARIRTRTRTERRHGAAASSRRGRARRRRGFRHRAPRMRRGRDSDGDSRLRGWRAEAAARVVALVSRPRRRAAVREQSRAVP